MVRLEKRGSAWFVPWSEGDRQRGRSWGTDSHQAAKEKLRRFGSELYGCEDCPLPTRTPIAGAVPCFPLSHWPTSPIRPILQA